MQLNERDRKAVIICGITVICFVAVQFIILPLFDKKKRLERTLVTKQQYLVQMQEMQARLLQLSSLGSGLAIKLEKRNKNFSLFSFLEEKAGVNGIKNKIAYMKPSDSVDSDSYKQILVEMKLQAINLKQLVSFLKDIEAPENLVGLQRISIQENKKSVGRLDVIMQVISIDNLDGGST